MPIYAYICRPCTVSLKKLVPGPMSTPKCPLCKNDMIRQIGVPDVIAMETCDPYRGRSRYQNTQEKARQRADEHFRTVEAKKLSLEEQKRRGYIRDEDKPKS